MKIICDNRKARHLYEILDTFESGMVLTGSEVKSLRDGRAHLNDAYADFQGGELFLFQAHIAPYAQASYNNHEPLRKRKLLLHKKELMKLVGQIQEKGLTLIPLQLYWKEGYAKIKLALSKGKKTFDKRESIKKRETDRTIARVMRNKNR